MPIIFMILSIIDNVMNDAIYKLSLRSFQKYPESSKNNIFVRNFLFFSFSAFFINIVTYLTNYWYRKINKSQDLGQCEMLKPLGLSTVGFSSAHFKVISILNNFFYLHTDYFLYFWINKSSVASTAESKLYRRN